MSSKGKSTKPTPKPTPKPKKPKTKTPKTKKTKTKESKGTQEPKEEGLKFIDLFCGIGGFHYALTLTDDNKTHTKNKCVLACDINKECRATYKDNFNLEPTDDVTKLENEEVPDFDILCAGFPCQPFSNGGKKKSFKDARGNLFEEIIRIAKCKKPSFMFLENVKHILKVDNGNVFKTILTKLREIDYVVSCQTLSPHQLGIPQQRERVIFTCIKKDVYEAKYKTKPDIFAHNDTPHKTDIIVKEETKETETTSETTETETETTTPTTATTKAKKPKEEKFDLKLYNDFNFDLGLSSEPTMQNIYETDKEKTKKYKISDELVDVLNAWDVMVKTVATGEKLSPTILCHEFKTIIFKAQSPIDTEVATEEEGEEGEEGKEGKEVVLEFDTAFDALVQWKKDYIQKNRPLYEKYKKQWKKWYKKHSTLLKKKEIYGKLEWQTGPKKEDDSIWKYFIQVRQSGIRVKKTNYFPTLVAIVQTPIYGVEKRYITPRECAKLQSFPDEFKLHAKDNIAYKQFGNAVNVAVIRTITNIILQNYN